ncbi:MAG: SRPBCC domain-containing protein [Cyclobacteriaceae bacterium]|jgi:uncharacterized protein YndB with AHSA1/START domain|nr:SRPBCC domain-containing protein [Cyclobacteriaceae bacterium]
MQQNKILVRAIVAAPIDKVWDYYTKPERITKWNFADPSWHCPTASNDLKVGGKYIARMEAKDGSSGFDFEVVYTEVIAQQKLSYQFDGRNATIDFISKQDKTEVIIQFDPETENSIELQREGWQAILNNFKKFTEEN